MVELTSLTPCSGLLPVSHGKTRLEEVDLGPLTLLAPFKGQRKALSDALKKAHGVSYPDANTTSINENVRALWFGRDAAVLTGTPPDAALAGYAAVINQSDAWTVVSLSGSTSVDVLARLVPVDLRLSHFPEGATARSLINHMSGSITRIGPDAFLILVFRSMAQTLVEELSEAMEAVATRG